MERPERLEKMADAQPTRDRAARRWKLAAALALALLVPLVVHVAPAAGITADEIVQRAYGDLILAFYRSHFTDERALSYVNLYLYGGLFELPVQLVVSSHLLPWPPYETRHVLTACVGLLGAFATWLTVNRMRGPRAALIAAAILLLTPAYFGHSLFNPKDIPFAAAASFVMYTSVRIALRAPPLHWRDAVFASLALGCALGVRPGGMFLLAYPVAAVCLRALLSGVQLRAAGVALARLVSTLPLAWLVMLSAWPWALRAPFTRPFQAAAIAADFDLSGKTRFDGSIVSFQHLPLDYLPTWYRVTLPDIYWLACLCGVLALVRAVKSAKLDPGQLSALLLVLAFVVMPIAGVLITRPTLYDGHRHFLFLIPGMAVLAGLALDDAICSPGLHAAVRGGLALLALLLAGVTFYDMWSLHPYEYVYFNRASGGLATQASRFETDYWGASYREGFSWVVDNYDRGGERKITLRSCAADKVLGYYRKQWHADRFVVSPARGASELYLSITKRDCHKKPGEVIYTVDRQGVPLLYVLRQK